MNDLGHVGEGIPSNSTDQPKETDPRLARLAKGRARAAELRAAGVVPEHLDPIERSRRNPTSRRLAINAKCWECSGAGADPGTRESIATCNVPKCPLHPVRPYQSSVDDGSE